MRQGGFLLGAFGVYQLIATIHAAQQEQLALNMKGAFHGLNVALGTAKTVTASWEAVLRLRAFKNKVALLAKDARQLQRYNIVLGGLTAAVGIAENTFVVWTACAGDEWKRGAWYFVKALGNGALLYCIFIPNPVLQASAMWLLIGMEVCEAIFGRDQKDTEISSSHVNVHLRNLVKLAKGRQNPLGVFLTDTERGSIAAMELLCNSQDIRHPAWGSTFNPGVAVVEDARLLRDSGFTLEQIKDLTGCYWLSIEDVMQDG